MDDTQSVNETVSIMSSRSSRSKQIITIKVTSATLEIVSKILREQKIIVIVQE